VNNTLFYFMPIEYFNNYLAKHHFKASIERKAHPDLSISIVIPCFNEPDIIRTLESLLRCERPSRPAEVLIVLNYPEASDPAIINDFEDTLATLNAWTASNSSCTLSFHVIQAPALPQKFAGVGLARKIGMDEASFRFAQNNNDNGIICGFDADATVDPNYLTEIEKHFNDRPKSPGASIYFEHPIETIANDKLRSGIVQYETHLRYLVNAIRYTGFPYSFHTVGSSFAVRAKAYVKQGGMNRFKAGEDFYFLNKIIPLGGFTEINTTRVIPQARVSNRVPFGTGASMTKWMAANDAGLLTYPFEVFEPLKLLFSNIERIYAEKAFDKSIVTDGALAQFLEENKVDDAIAEMFENSGSLINFVKRFYAWFDAFKIVKYLNYACGIHPKKIIYTEGQQLLAVYVNNLSVSSNEELLSIYRRWDRQGLDSVC
jgi:cellulose synthase/poly-beta-1,6-N-acetylglucosamine synthase-like glycosyltransferase